MARVWLVVNRSTVVFELERRLVVQARMRRLRRRTRITSTLLHRPTAVRANRVGVAGFRPQARPAARAARADVDRGQEGDEKRTTAATWSCWTVPQGCCSVSVRAPS